MDSQFAKHTHTYNSRLAQELRKLANAQLGVEAMHRGLYRADFIDNIAVGDVEEVLMIVAALDLDVEGAQSYDFPERLVQDAGTKRRD